jgi:hypothetical protein
MTPTRARASSLVLACILSAMAGPIAFALLAAVLMLYSGNVADGAVFIITTAFIGYLVTLPINFVVGLPAAFVLRRRNLLNGKALCATGALVGGVTFPCLFWAMSGAAADSDGWECLVGAGLGLGLVTGAAFHGFTAWIERHPGG